jgi:hypothetical protein
MGKRRDVYREALITEIRLPRDQAEAAIDMGPQDARVRTTAKCALSDGNRACATRHFGHAMLIWISREVDK